jgi:hypothetical protein
VGGSEGVLDSKLSLKLAEGSVDDFLGEANI